MKDTLKTLLRLGDDKVVVKEEANDPQGYRRCSVLVSSAGPMPKYAASLNTAQVKALRDTLTEWLGYDQGLLATLWPASAGHAQRLIDMEPDDSDNTRSGWEWVRFANGDLMLGTFPQGDTYMELEVPVETDWAAAYGTEAVRTVRMAE
jgi:hypothetical protein